MPMKVLQYSDLFTVAKHSTGSKSILFKVADLGHTNLHGESSDS